jgi:WD40 repeat protein
MLHVLFVTICLLEVVTSQSLTLSNHTAQVNALAFSSDHSLLISGSNDKTIDVWNTTDWTLESKLTNNQTQCSDLVLLPDNKLASASGRNIIIFQGSIETQTLSGHTGTVNCLALSPTGGSILASGSQDFTIRFWDSTASQTVASAFQTTGPVTALVFMSIHVLASGSSDWTIKIWDTSSGK